MHTGEHLYHFCAMHFPQHFHRCLLYTSFSDRTGRVLIIEPGIGYRLEKEKYSLITNYSIPVSYTHLDVYKRQAQHHSSGGFGAAG